MNTTAFQRYLGRVSAIRAYVNSLEIYMELAQERIQEIITNAVEKEVDEKIFTSVYPITSHDEKYRKMGTFVFPASSLNNFVDYVKKVSYNNSIINIITLTEIYLTELCEWVMENNPSSFSSKENINLTYEEIVKLDGINHLKKIVLKKMKSEYTHENLANSITELIINKFHWKIKNFKQEITHLRDLSLLRNIIVHNDSKVNEIFLTSISNPGDFKLGKSIFINFDIFNGYLSGTISFIKNIDDVVMKKCKKSSKHIS